MRDLIAALEEIRTALLRIIAALEEGDVLGALRLIEDAHATWTAAVEQLRAGRTSE